MRDRLLKQILFLILGIGLFHALALLFYWYWTVWWFDLPLHYIGGAASALFSLWAIFLSGYANFYSKRPAYFLATAVVCVLSIGILWELFEFILGATFSREDYAIDTAIDLMMDVAGGLSGYIFFVIAKYEDNLLKHINR